MDCMFTVRGMRALVIVTLSLCSECECREGRHQLYLLCWHLQTLFVGVCHLTTDLHELDESLEVVLCLFVHVSR